MEEIENHIRQINELCITHDVRSLFAFGSIVSDKLKTESDIDLIVDIDSKDPFIYADNYFALKFQLENILNRHIDLLEDKAVRNPFLKKQIEDTKVLVYAK